MITKIACSDFVIHEVPFEEVEIRRSYVMVNFDSIEKKRICIKFQPFQAVKMTTIDCYPLEYLFVDGNNPRCLLEIERSTWINELAVELAKRDRLANFLGDSHHYLLPFQDNVLEILAWKYELIPLIILNSMGDS